MSHFSEAATWTLLTATVALAVSAVAVRMIIWLGRIRSPGIQRVAWAAVLAQGVVLAHFTVAIPWGDSEPLPVEAGPASDEARDQGLLSPVAVRPPERFDGPSTDGIDTAAAVAQTAVNNSPVSSWATASEWPRLVVILWGAGMGGCVLISLVAYVRFARVVGAAEPGEAGWQRQWQALLAANGVRRPIPLCVTESIGPVLCRVPSGYRLIVPRRQWRELSPEERLAILRHELSHYRRGDLWKTLVVRLLALPHWFNPFAWYAVRRFEECAEWACDRAAAGDSPSEAAGYAKALLRLGGAASPATSLASAAGTSPLAGRIRRVLSGTTPVDSKWKQLAVALVVLAMIVPNVMRVELVAREAGIDEPAAPGDDQKHRTSDGRWVDLYGDPLPERAIARLGTVRLQQQNYLLGVAFTPDGKSLVSSGWGPAVRFWDAKTGKPQRSFVGTERRGTFGVAFSPDGTKMASVGEAGLVRLWDVSTGKELFKTTNHKERTYGVAFAPDGATFATTGGDATVRLWDVATGTELLTFSNLSQQVFDAHAIAFSPDGKFMAAGTRETIRLWNLDTGAEPIVIENAHGRETISLAFTWDGRRLISGGYRIESDVNEFGERVGRSVSEIRVWNVADGKQTDEWKSDEELLHGGALAISQGGTILVSGHYGKLVVWNVATGKVMRVIKEEGVHFGGRTHALAISSDGQTLAAKAEDNRVRLWDMTSGRRLLNNADTHDKAVTIAQFSPDGKQIATCGGDGTVRLWNPQTGKQVHQLLSGGGWIQSVLFSPDGEHVITAFNRSDQSKDIRQLQIFSRETGQLVRQIDVDDHVAVATLSVDGKLLAAATGPMLPWAEDRSGTVHVWEFRTGRKLAELSGHEESIVQLAFSPDGKTIISASKDNTIRRWDIASQKEIEQLDVSGHHHRTNRDGVRVATSLHSAVFSPDHSTAFTSGQWSDSFIAWDLAAKKERMKVHIPDTEHYAMDLSPDGRILATARNTHPGDHSIHLYDTATGKELLQLEPEDGRPRSFGFSPDGKRLVTGTNRGTALVWDIAEVYEKLAR